MGQPVHVVIGVVGEELDRRGPAGCSRAVRGLGPSRRGDAVQVPPGVVEVVLRHYRSEMSVALQVRVLLLVIVTSIG